MEYILIAGWVGLVIGFSLGALAMALLVASYPDELPEPGPEVRESSVAGVGVGGRGRSIVGIAEPTHAFTGGHERDSD
jgi:hypothetical protein